jgi:hypothetical protein
MNTFSQNLRNLFIIHDQNGCLDFRYGSILDNDYQNNIQDTDFDSIIHLGWAIKSSQGGPYTRIEITPFGEKIIKEIFDVCKKFTQGL